MIGWNAACICQGSFLASVGTRPVWPTALTCWPTASRVSNRLPQRRAKSDMGVMPLRSRRWSRCASLDQGRQGAYFPSASGGIAKMRVRIVLFLSSPFSTTSHSPSPSTVRFLQVARLFTRFLVLPDVHSFFCYSSRFTRTLSEYILRYFNDDDTTIICYCSASPYLFFREAIGYAKAFERYI
jgi:hypothetical protein